MPEDWLSLLTDKHSRDSLQAACTFVVKQRALGHVIYPAQQDVFNAFTLTPLDQVKVVILGQDPYHGPGQAHGLSFSVRDGHKIPPSLRNIYKELLTDIEGFRLPEHGNLSAWAQQGVLLLNTVLTVQDGVANSHQKQGWEQVTDSIIRGISEQLDGVVFLLWGKPAQLKVKLIDAHKHYVLQSTHPSPLSAHRGFLGCGHFSQCNALLTQQGKQAINWQV